MINRRIAGLVVLSSLLVSTSAFSQIEKKPKSKPKTPPQTTLAAKSAFATIPATDPLVKSAFPATNLAGAKKLVGKSTPIVGTVTKVFAPKSNKVVLLNFAKDYKTALVAVIKAPDFPKFPDLSKLEGKKVLLTGKVVLYKGTPEIELTKPGSIQLVK